MSNEIRSGRPAGQTQPASERLAGVLRQVIWDEMDAWASARTPPADGRLPRGYQEVGEDALQLFKIPQAAARLGVSDRTVRRLIASGDLASVRVGRAIRIAHEDLAAYIAELRGSPPS